MNSDDDDGNDDDDGVNKASKSSAGDNVYRPPKVSATPYELAEQGSKAKDKRDAKRLKILARSKMLQEARAEVSGKPMVVRDALPEMEALRDEDKERQAYEEKSFQRLMYTKKDKQRRNAVRRQARSSTSFAKLESFDGIESALAPSKGSDDEYGADESGMNFSAKRARSLAQFEKQAANGNKRPMRGSDERRKKKARR